MGRRQTKETREKIRESLIAFNRKRYEERDPKTEPELKRCTKCGVVKHVSEYHTERFKAKNGLESLYPASYCKVCRNKEVRERRQRKLKEDYEGTREREREYKRRFKKRNPGREKEWQARYRRAKADKEGRKMREYIPKEGKAPPADVEIPVAPLREYLNSLGMTVAEVHRQSQIDERIIRAVMTNEDKEFVRMHTVDKILLGLEVPWKLNELYPPEAEFGYRIVDPAKK